MSDWIELFSGESLRGWTARADHAWRICGGVSLDPSDPTRFIPAPGDGVLINGDCGETADLHTVLEHGDCRLTLEYCIPSGSNSGVYLMGLYEIQIFDNWDAPDKTLTFGSNGGIYAQWDEAARAPFEGRVPNVNASRPPGEWQELQVIFRAARFDEEGRKASHAFFESVVLNGKVIHENAECTGPTRGGWSKQDLIRGPLRLQGDHGPVAFRSIRMLPYGDREAGDV